MYWVLCIFAGVLSLISLAKNDISFLILSAIFWVGSLIILTIQRESFKIQKAMKRD